MSGHTCILCLWVLIYYTLQFYALCTMHYVFLKISIESNTPETLCCCMIFYPGIYGAKNCSAGLRSNMLRGRWLLFWPI